MKDFLVGIDCERAKTNYKGGINTFIFGFIDGIIYSRLNNKFLIICTEKNFKIFKKYKKKLKIIIIKDLNVIKKTILFICAILNLKEKFFFFNKNFYSEKNKKLKGIVSHIYTPTSIINNYYSEKTNILSPHDIQHIYYPENFSYLRLKYRTFCFKHSINYANFIQASSKFIKENIESTYNIKNKIKIISEGVDLNFFKKKKIKKKNIIFFPAYFWPHKNHNFIISAFKKIIFKYKIDCKLIMCGGFPNEHNNIKNKINGRYDNKILHLGLIKKNKIRSLYQKSRVVISAASYESSSLPILEAVACGAHILASNTGPNVELKKKLYFDIYDLNNFTSFKRKFFKIWNNKKFYKKLNQDNQRKIRTFNWTNYAKKIYKLAKNNG